MDVDIGEIHFQTRRKDDFVHSFETLNLDCIHFITRMKQQGTRHHEQPTMFAKVFGFICRLSFSSYMFIRNSIFCFTCGLVILVGLPLSNSCFTAFLPSECQLQGQANPPKGKGSSQRPETQLRKLGTTVFLASL